MRISDWSSDVCSSDLFKNRYGTSLYSEIELPKRAAVPPSDGPFPVILALEGVNTNVAMYRWWHQAFADAGYLVFAFDFAGQGHSGDRVAGDERTEARRVGKEFVRTCRSRWSRSP